MKALVRRQFGGPDVVRVEEVERPPLPDDRVLVRVRASSINKADFHTLKGTPLLFRPLSRSGLLRPKNPLFGSDIAGVVEAVGSDVTDIAVGDEVFGGGPGGYAEYVAAKYVVKKPANATTSFSTSPAVTLGARCAVSSRRAAASSSSGGTPIGRC